MEIACKWHDPETERCACIPNDCPTKQGYCCITCLRFLSCPAVCSTLAKAD